VLQNLDAKIVEGLESFATVVASRCDSTYHLSILGMHPSELAALAPKGRVALIMNALDNRPEAREKWRSGQRQKLETLGLTVSDLDLRDFFAMTDRLRGALEGFDMVWINGGNAFILRRAMKLSRMDEAILSLLDRDEIVYAGVSAAAVIASHSLRGLDAVDDPHDVPAGYPAEIEWKGLGILPFAIVVHYKSNHSEFLIEPCEMAKHSSFAVR
jgi:dipeptidase E